MKQEQNTPTQVTLAMISVLLVKSFHTFPRGIAEGTGTAAPWMILLAGAAALLLLWPVLLALKRRSNIVKLAVEAGGRPLAIATTLLLTLSVILSNGMSVRQVSEMAVTAIYPHTPQTWLIVSLVAAGAVGGAMSPAGLIWIGVLYAIPTLLSIAVVIVGNIGWGQFLNVLPVTGPGFVPLAGQLLPLTSYFGELAYLTMNAEHLTDPARAGRIAAGTVGGVAGVWAAILLVFLMVFPLPGGLAIPFPVYEMTRLLQGGRFLERMDAFWIIFWAFGSAGRLAAGFLFASSLFKEAFGLPSHRGAVLPLAMATLATAMFPSNQAAAIDSDTHLIRHWGFLITLVLPSLVAVWAWLRRRKRHAA